MNMKQTHKQSITESLEEDKVFYKKCVEYLNKTYYDEHSYENMLDTITNYTKYGEEISTLNRFITGNIFQTNADLKEDSNGKVEVLRECVAKVGRICIENGIKLDDEYYSMI